VPVSERVKYAAVGCGGMGRRHLRGMAVLAKSSMCNVELVAVCDLRREQAELLVDEAQEMLGYRPPIFTSIEDMMREMPEIEAADVTVDTGAHYQVAKACLQAGVHVLCEKPLAVTVRGCLALIDAARRHAKVLSVAENFRRDPMQRLGKALLHDGAIGTPRVMLQTVIGGRDHIQITPWRHMKETGSMPVDGGVHEADLLRFYLGEFTQVFGQSRLHERVRYNSGSAGPGGFYAAYAASMPDSIEPTGDDAIYAHVAFESGAIAHWVDDHAGHGLRKDERVIFGSRGSLEVSGNRNGRPVKLHLDDSAVEDSRVLEYAPSHRLSPLAAELFGAERPWHYGFTFQETDARLIALEYHELGSCVRSGAVPEVTGEEGLADVALTYAAFESGRLGRAVTFQEMMSAEVDVYQREIDQKLGLLSAAALRI
jgi:predicted dehydrogenase